MQKAPIHSDRIGKMAMAITNAFRKSRLVADKNELRRALGRLAPVNAPGTPLTAREVRRLGEQDGIRPEENSGSQDIIAMRGDDH